MGRRWVAEHRRDPYTRRAKRQDYRSRAAFKLLQMNRRFRVFKRGSVVLDLGCAPGGWTQVAASTVGPSGMVVGVDLDPVGPIEGTVLVQGDLTEAATQEAVRAALEGRGVDAVLSDMSPNISGVYDVDHARSMALVRLAADFGLPLMRRGGNLLVKVFAGPDLAAYVAALRSRFARVKRTKPEASRKASSEVYVVALGFGGVGPPEWSAFEAPRGDADEDDDEEYWPPEEGSPED